MHTLLIEPYYGGSHRAWVDGYTSHSQYNITKLTMPAKFWKWRMQGGAVTMAREYHQLINKPELIIASDMLDVSLFRSLISTKDIPIALYFHENQLTYPQNRRQQHGWQYGFINYASSLAADALFFNSQFHLDSFFSELPKMLKHFADYNELQTVADLRHKASVLPLGLSLQRFEAYRAVVAHKTPIILWNHRWEADKNPKAFFNALYSLADEGLAFHVVLLGENFRQTPQEFEVARQRLGGRILHYGYVNSFAEYARWLWQADYVISTAYQDFFGIAVSEAIYCGCVPILANRLNYPYLIPQKFHTHCLFQQDELTKQLRQHLMTNSKIETTPLQKNIAQYDWTIMAKQYDSTFEQLV